MKLIRDYPHDNAIKVGSFYLKPKSVYETLTHCCRMVLYEADEPAFPLGRSGSATLVQYAGIKYVIMTRHELQIPNGVEPPKDILTTIRVSSGSKQLTNIPLQNCLYETSNPEEEYHDVLIFETASTWENKEIDAPYFFPLTPFVNSERTQSFMVGYPFIDGMMDEHMEKCMENLISEKKEGAPPEEKGTIHLKVLIGDCDMDNEFKSNAEYFRRYIQSKSRPYMNGFSGGAVFSLVGEIDNMKMVLDGIILRANERYVHVVDVDYLVKAVTRQRSHNESTRRG